MNIALNCAVATRGISGTARSLQHIRGSIERSGVGTLTEVWPERRLRHSKLWNAAVQAEWDLHGAARAAAGQEVLISPCNIGRARRAQRHVAVIHDTMVLDEPALFDTGYASYARILFAATARNADVVVCPSAFSAERLRSRWPWIRKIVVAHWPVEIQAIPRERVGGPPTALVVGATEPHKRQVVAIEAVTQARLESGVDIRLNIVGPPGRAEAEVGAVLARVDPEQQWTQRLIGVPAAHLEELYRDATVLLQPSRFEGYGLPVAEAASFGCPSIHSGQGSLREISPSGAVQDDSADGYCAALVQLLDPARRAAHATDALAEARLLSREAFDRQLISALALTG